MCTMQEMQETFILSYSDFFIAAFMAKFSVTCSVLACAVHKSDRKTDLVAIVQREQNSAELLMYQGTSFQTCPDTMQLSFWFACFHPEIFLGHWDINIPAVSIIKMPSCRRSALYLVHDSAVQGHNFSQGVSYMWRSKLIQIENISNRLEALILSCIHLNGNINLILNTDIIWNTTLYYGMW